jgi:hypothetical protein
MHRKNRRLWLLALPIVAAAVTGLIVNHRSASAVGVPVNNPLFYSGRIVESGTPANGTRSIIIDFWDDATSTDSAHRQCETAATTTTVTNGLFRVALDPSCVTAIHSTSDMWAEITVGTVSLGRRKIGAVPFALEAAHAADVPPSALVLPSSLITSTTGNLADWRNNSSVSVALKWTDIPGRSVTFSKKYATSKLRVTYQDTLGTYGYEYQGCEWQILLDGTAIQMFSDADSDTPAANGIFWRMANAAHVAWATGAVGSHTVSVQNRGNRGAWGSGTTECLQGWNTTGNFLSVEEIP